jgi:hypothetical protein
VDRLWHIPFNQLAETNEQLVRGREDIFIGAEYDASAGTSKLAEQAPEELLAALTAFLAPYRIGVPA